MRIRITSKHYPYICILFPVAALILSWVIIPGSFNGYDNADFLNYYLPVAQNILNGEGITLHSQIAIGYPAGYPLLLSSFLFLAKITGVNEIVVLRLAFILIIALGALLIYSLAKLLWSPALALSASILWSFFPLVLWSGRNPYTELPFVIFFYGALLLFLKAWNGHKRLRLFFFSCGILCGCSMLIRPIAIGLGLLFMFFVLIGRRYHRRKNWLFALLILLGNAAAVLPWELWAYAKTHRIIFLCSGRASASMLDGLTFAVMNPDGKREKIAVPVDVKKLMIEIADNCSDHPLTITSRELITVIAGHLKKQPVAVMKLYLIKAIRSWYGTNTNRFETPLKLVQSVYFLLLVWSLFLFWKEHKERRDILIGALCLLGYFWCMTILVLSIVRYLMPILGALIIFFPVIYQNKSRRMTSTTIIPTKEVV